MALLLNIDTATELAGVCLSLGDTILAIEETAGQKNHASFIQSAISRIMLNSGYTLGDIDAIAVTCGPGSYTGLRVGLATAKGLCYALKKPLILVNTLEVMALAAINAYRVVSAEVTNVIFCPMIDARRMEVFTALYSPNLEVIIPPSAVILDENSFHAELIKQKIVFSGSGSTKATIIQHPNAVFSNVLYSTQNLAALALMCYNTSKFSSLAYSEPHYLKEFYKKA